MASGIILPSVLSIAASASEAIIFTSQAQRFVDQNSEAIQTNGPWTPPQYSQPALTILQVPSGSSLTNGQPSSPQINYVFDAVLKIIHRRIIRKTSHPVLTGANLTDHAYVEPSRVSLEIGMSDVMAAYQNGMWTGASTKSISAWQTLKQLALSKTPLTLITRLDTYLNMIIIETTAPDDNKTKFGLRAALVLEEILTASVISVATASARPQTTNSTPGGTVQAIVPNGSQVEQFQIPSPLYPDVKVYPTVPGAGKLSGNSLSGVEKVFTGASGTPHGGG